MVILKEFGLSSTIPTALMLKEQSHLLNMVLEETLKGSQWMLFIQLQILWNSFSVAKTWTLTLPSTVNSEMWLIAQDKGPLLITWTNWTKSWKIRNPYLSLFGIINMLRKLSKDHKNRSTEIIIERLSQLEVERTLSPEITHSADGSDGNNLRDKLNGHLCSESL